MRPSNSERSGIGLRSSRAASAESSRSTPNRRRVSANARRPIADTSSIASMPKELFLGNVKETSCDVSFIISEGSQTLLSEK